LKVKYRKLYWAVCQGAFRDFYFSFSNIPKSSGFVRAFLRLARRGGGDNAFADMDMENI